MRGNSTHEPSSITILIPAEFAALVTFKEVGCWRAAFIKGTKKLIPLGVVRETSGVPNRLNCLWTKFSKFLESSTPDELGCITTMRPPAFLLPARKAWRAKGNLFYRPARNRIPFATPNLFLVMKGHVKLRVCRAIGDAPRADALRILLLGIDRPDIDVTTRPVAADALFC